MHGLINRSIQCFVRDTYGEATWRSVARSVGIGPDGFEPMLAYDDAVTDTLLHAVAAAVGNTVEAMLEDLGTYLVSHETTRGIRRLLRFSGETFADFLHSLDDLPSRAKLAMPDLDLPDLELREDPHGRFRLFVLSNHAGWGHAMLGLLRALADDYGALVVMEMAPGSGSVAVIEISLLDAAYAEGRSFSLAEGGDLAGREGGGALRLPGDDPVDRAPGAPAGPEPGAEPGPDRGPNSARARLRGSPVGPVGAPRSASPAGFHSAPGATAEGDIE